MAKPRATPDLGEARAAFERIAATLIGVSVRPIRASALSTARNGVVTGDQCSETGIAHNYGSCEDDAKHR
jgi:hypothetical protein